MLELPSFKRNLKIKASKYLKNLKFEYNNLASFTFEFPDFQSILSREPRKSLLVLPTETFGSLIYNYCSPNFDILTYSYSEKTSQAKKKFPYNGNCVHHLSFESEFFGESLRYIVKYLSSDLNYDQYLILNGDIIISFDDIITCFDLAQMHSLDLFLPSLSSDSYYSHKHLLN